MPKGLGTQIIAGILGLLFVIGVILVGRQIGKDLKNRFLSQRERKIEKTTKLSPTPTAGVTDLEQAMQAVNQRRNTLSTQTKGGIREIPKTGAETLLLTALLLPMGYLLRTKFAKP